LVVTSEQAQVRFDELTDEVGGAEAMAAWLAANGYTVEGLQQALTEEMQAQAMVSEIVNTLGNQAEQVHARHILVATRDQAQDLRDQIAAGEDFDLLARQWTQDLSTRPAGGDLGWFPRGVLLVAEVEQAAFSLPDGTLSEVIESPLGFHLVEPLERGVRPLSPQSLVRLRQLAVEAWLAEQRAASVVEILITP
jgi:parvulin-like peptidyl-prolyl isomerase